MSVTPAESTTEVAARPRWGIWLALAIVYVVWGSTYLVIKIALAGFPPFAMGAVRFTLAGVGLLAWLALRGQAKVSALQLRNTAITGTLMLLGGNGLVCYAEQSVSSGLAAVVVASMPLFAALWAGLYGAWPQRGDWLGLVIGFAGIVLLNLGGDLAGSPQGSIALLAASASWAFGTVWSRRQDMPSPWLSTALQMIFGGIALGIVHAAVGTPFPGWPGLSSWLALSYLIVAGSIAGFTAYVYLVGQVRPALATSYAYANPPIAVLIGVLLGGEHLGSWDLVAMAVVLSGVVVIVMGKR